MGDVKEGISHSRVVHGFAASGCLEPRSPEITKQPAARSPIEMMMLRRSSALARAATPASRAFNAAANASGEVKFEFASPFELHRALFIAFSSSLSDIPPEGSCHATCELMTAIYCCVLQVSRRARPSSP